MEKVAGASGGRGKGKGGCRPPSLPAQPVLGEASEGAVTSAPSDKKRGIGIACSAYLTGAGTAIYWNSMPHSGVLLRADRGGGIAVLCGATDIGQGSDSILA